MKILCISDHIDPVVYSSRIQKRFGDVAMVLGCGDMKLTYFDFIITNLNVPLYFVFGNHHVEQYEFYNNKAISSLYYYQTPKSKFRSVGATYIDRKVIMDKDLIIMGLGGCMWYNGGLNQFSELGMMLKILKTIPRLLLNKLLHRRFLDILITHAPPFEIHDQKDICHRGFKVFLWFMRFFKPRYLIHGHVHLYSKNSNRIDKYHDTLIVNAYDHVVIEVEEDNGQKVRNKGE